MLCCGLCGAAPAFATMMASPLCKPNARRAAAAAAATAAATAPEQEAPAEAAQPVVVAAVGPAAKAGSAEEKPAAGADGEAADEAARAAAAATAAEAGPEEEDGTGSPLFRSSVTLPAAYFPPERFHTGGVSMPLEVFVGAPLPSEEQATNAAALLALAALHRLGIIVRYWPSRLLLAQHLLPRSLAAAAPPGALPGASPAGGNAPPVAAAGWAAGMAGDASAAAPPAGAMQPGQQPNVMNFFCPLCNVAATGHKVGAPLQIPASVLDGCAAAKPFPPF